MQNQKISVIIVNFNCGTLLTSCVRHVLTSTVPVEVFVSDNGSTDGSIEHLRREIQDKRLHIKTNDQNLGFSKGSNIVLSKVTGNFLLFLNPDCIISTDTLEKMRNIFNTHTCVGMAGCLILNPDGSEQAGCRRRVPTPARTLIRVLHLDRLFPSLYQKRMLLNKDPLPDKPEEMEAISGAFMLITREALEDVGPLDEGYFLHCEDLDWCMRFRQNGWKIMFEPSVHITHFLGSCSKKSPLFVEWYKHKGMLRFYRKFFYDQYPRLLIWLIVIGVWLRFGLVATWKLARRQKDTICDQ